MTEQEHKEEHQSGIGLRTRPLGRKRTRIRKIAIEGSELKVESVEEED